MSSNHTEKDQYTKVLRRIARIWSIAIIAIGILIFAGLLIESLLTNPATTLDYPWWENLMPLMMFLAIVGLAIAWRWEGLGALITLAGLLANLILYILTGRSEVLIVVAIMIPVLIPAVLFLICWFRARRVELNPNNF